MHAVNMGQSLYHYNAITLFIHIGHLDPSSAMSYIGVNLKQAPYDCS